MMLTYILFGFLYFGLALGKDKGKIIGGELANENEFPFVVSLQMRSIRLHYCVGNLIKYDKVFTACHCILSSRSGNLIMHNVKEILVAAGMVDREDENQQTASVRSTQRHPRCEPMGNGYWYDYAMVSLMKPFSPFYRDIHVTLMPVYTTNHFKLNAFLRKTINKSNVCVAAGWGYAEQYYNNASDEYVSYGTSQYLKKLNITVIRDKTCLKALCQPPKPRCLNLKKFASRHLICGMGPPGQDVCSGDSGGPLLCMGFVVGILSWGPACGEYPYPSMYANIDLVVESLLFASKSSKFTGTLTILTLITNFLNHIF